MIKSFRDKTTEDIYNGNNTKDTRAVPKSIWDVTCRKLDMLNAMQDLKDIVVSRGNHLEKLKGDLSGYLSIRINDQYRIIFKWRRGNVESVQIVDYH